MHRGARWAVAAGKPAFAPLAALLRWLWSIGGPSRLGSGPLCFVFITHLSLHQCTITMIVLVCVLTSHSFLMLVRISERFVCRQRTGQYVTPRRSVMSWPKSPSMLIRCIVGWTTSSGMYSQSCQPTDKMEEYNYFMHSAETRSIMH